jgi:FtsP/CotA-like multicopper oxidase with cupredoxin domain
MRRREFLKYGSASAAGLALGLGVSGKQGALAATCSSMAVYNFTLVIMDKAMEMVDGEILNAIAFANFMGASVPGPVLRVREGAIINLTVYNNRPEPHGFAITGIDEATIPSIAPNGAACVSFVAPPGGSYLYHDPLYNGSYRLVGLHGAFVSEPIDRLTPLGRSPTPYSVTTTAPYAAAAQTPAVQAVFDAMGTTTRFAGEKWKPGDPDREKIWLFNQVDPRFNALVVPGQPLLPNALMDDPVAAWEPRYFTINGRSGFFLSDAASTDVVPRNYIGEPTLIRVMNAGLCCHAAHIHGNHPFELSHAERVNSSEHMSGKVVVHDNVLERDVFQILSMERKDWLLPFEVPPDIPIFPQLQEPFPLRYVMHCHTEMSQTAAGGNYPQGLVTHFEILGPRGGRPLQA